MILRKFRKVTAGLVFFMFAFIFVDFWGFTPNWLLHVLTGLQFTPSLIKFVFTFSLLSFGFILIIALNLIWGRVYCSFLCPLGILQDIFSRISVKFHKRKIFRYSNPHNILRYAILIVTIITVAYGSMLLINFLDPFSNFGKIISTLIRPIIVLANNILALALNLVQLYILYPVELKYGTWQIYIYPILFLTILILFTYKRGRLFCNTLCPVGASLSIASKFSVYKIAINKNSCTQCGKCISVCKAQCIDVKNKEIDFSRCVTCYNCLPVCSENGIGYTSLKSNATIQVAEININESRRNFFSKFFISVGSISGVYLLQKASANSNHNQTSKIINNKQFAVSPPGSISQRNFTKRCIGCELCVSNCPTGVLQPMLNAYGLLNAMQPGMDFTKSFCNYECVKCSEVCPTGAIMPLNIEQKKVTQTGIVHFIKENCVVFTNETSCGACSEHCPTKAVQMVPYKNNLTIPQTNPNICIGCGACEFACPVRPHRAIYVNGNNAHQQAQLPVEHKLEEKMLEDFPF